MKVNITRCDLSTDGEDDIWLARVLRLTELCKSTGEAMRLIKGGGVRVNGIKVVDKDTTLDADRVYNIQRGLNCVKVNITR